MVFNTESIIIDIQNEEWSKSTLVWNINWIREFESIWSILQKMNYANGAQQIEMFAMLSKNKSSNWKTFLSFKKGSLTTQLHFDKIKLEQYELDKLFHESKLFINQMASGVGIAARHVFEHDVLRFCESCLELGYHSNFHQLRFLTICPIHNKDLTESCPVCFRRYAFNLTNPNLAKPYVCICGHCYMDVNHPIKMFKMFQRELKGKETMIPEMNLITEDSFMSRVVFSEIGPPQKLKNHVQRVLQLKQTGKIEAGSETSILISRSLFKPNHNAIKKQVNPFLESSEMYNDQRAIYKSIARMLRNTIMKFHRGCVRNLSIKGSFSNVCHYAHAYVCWRKFIEGLNGYHNVQNGFTTKNRFATTPKSYYSPIFDDALRSFMRQYEKAIMRLIEEIGDGLVHEVEWLSTCIRNRLFADLVLNNFYQWVGIYKNAKTYEVTYYHEIPFDPLLPLQEVYININNFVNNRQLIYIRCKDKFQKSRLWCDLVGRYI
ncbi:hypothetical protein ACFVR2_07555 [Gottfriedia sp. NPDC057991]|uniref:hypothetical protein n=1 Tax=Gottfriedia sp. NPDC057991 TaxID=3346298 RepID=UPI0036DF02FB